MNLAMTKQDNANIEFIYGVVYGRNGGFSISASSPTTWSAKLIYTDKQYVKAEIVTEVLSFSEALQKIRDKYEERMGH